MEVQFQSIHFDADQKLLEHIQTKLDKLEKIFDKIISAEVYMKFENEGSSIKDKIVEVKLNLPNRHLFAKETSKAFEESADMAVESIRRQLRKYKDKIKS